MLPKKNRISAKLRIQYVYKKGIRFNTKLFQFRYLANKIRLNRFAVMLPGKIGDAGAVGRNKIRRRVHEAIRLGLSTAPVSTAKQTCYDIAVQVHKEAAKAEYEQMETEINLFLKKL